MALLARTRIYTCEECGRKLYSDEYHYEIPADKDETEWLQYCSEKCLEKDWLGVYATLKSLTEPRGITMARQYIKENRNECRGWE